MNDFIDLTAAVMVRYADERSNILEILRYIAGHARMARHHANEQGCRASLENVERAALDAIATITSEPAAGDI